MVVYHDRNLIINYIPRNLSDLDLSNLFSTVGPIKTCRIIRDHNSGSSFGFGFCEYEDAESAHRAIERFNGYRIADKILKVSLAKLQGRLYQSSNLYVKNFPLSITDDEIAAEFSRFGKVLQCRILRDRETNTSKGSAYVLFDSRTDAENARRALDGSFWPGSSDGQPLEIKFATPPYRQPSSINQNRTTHHRAAATCSGEMGGEEQPSSLSSLQNRSAFVCDSGVNCAAQFFQDPVYGNPVQPIHGSLPVPFCVQSSPNSPGITWVPEYLPDSVGLAPLQLAPTYLPPYFYTQNPTFPGFWPAVQPNLSAQAFGLLYGNQLDGITNAVHGCPVLAGLPSSFSNSNLQGSTALHGLLSGLFTEESGVKKARHVKSEKSNSASVYVYNIGNLMTERRLSELFSRFGAVLNVSIPRDPKTNFTRNFGFVTFNSLHCAQLAINSMNGFVYDGRRLQVSLRKPKNSNVRTCTDVPSKLFVDVPEVECMSTEIDQAETSTDSFPGSAKAEKLSTPESCAESLNMLHLNDVITSQNTVNSCCPPGITT